MSYEVQTPVFEGPFDLLLHLILREQVDLYEVTLCTIVDAYVSHLAAMEELDLEVATEFLMIAATLVELKARRLLPDESDPDLDDELGLWEERDLLLSRLLECKTFKDAATTLRRLADLAGRSYPRCCGPDERFALVAPDLLEGIDVADLQAAFIRAITPKPAPRVDTFHIHQIKISVMDAVAELAEELPRVGRISFRSLTESFVERLEVVVRFLALLELYKQGMVDLAQTRSFGDIEISWVGDALGPVGVELALVDSYEG